MACSLECPGRPKPLAAALAVAASVTCRRLGMAPHDVHVAPMMQEGAQVELVVYLEP